MIRQTLHHFRKLPTNLRTSLSHHLLSPRTILSELKVEEGDTILELGNPVGFFAAAGLTAVGKPGRFIVAGPNEESFDRIAHLKHHPQLEEVLLAEVLMNRAFDHHSADWIILTNVLSSSLYPDQFCLSIGSYLKPDGKVVLLDWKADQAAGPEAQRRIDSEQAIRLLTDCGLVFETTLKTPGSHYGLVFKAGTTVK